MCELRHMRYKAAYTITTGSFISTELTSNKVQMKHVAKKMNRDSRLQTKLCRCCYIYIYTDIQVSDCAGYLCNKLGVQFGAIQTTTCE